MRKNLKLSANTQHKIKFAAEYFGTEGLDVTVVISEKCTAKIILEEDVGWFSLLPWTEFSFCFETSDKEEYVIDLQLSDPKAKADYLNVYSLAPLQGLSFYLPEQMSIFDDQKTVTEAEKLTEVHLKGGLNQSLSVMFALQSPEKLKDVQLFLTAPEPIDSSCFELRAVNKGVLPKSFPRDMVPEGRLAWWLNFYPPGNGLKAAEYRGKIELCAGSEKLMELPLVLQIEDYQLPDADIAFLLYHSERYIPGRYLDSKMRAAFYEDMKKHGMNSVTVYNNPDAGEDGMDFEHNQQFCEEELKLRTERNCPGMDKENSENWQKRYDFGLREELNLIQRSGLAEFPLLWLAGKISYSEDRNDWWGGMPPERAAAILQKWQENKWPEVLYYVIDETLGYRDRTEKALELLQNLKKLPFKIKTTSANLQQEETGHLYDVWIQSVSRITDAMQKAAEEKKAELWCYSCSTANYNLSQPRSLFGFWAARSGVKGVAQWAYYDARDNFCAFKAEELQDKSRCCLSMVGITAEGPVPTFAWESVREGTIDYRISLYFRQSMNDLSKYENTEAQELYEKGQKVWTRIIDSIPKNLFAPLQSSGSFTDRNNFTPVISLGEIDSAWNNKRTALLKFSKKIKKFLQANKEKY